MPDILGTAPPLAGQAGADSGSFPRTHAAVPGTRTLADVRLQGLLPVQTRGGWDLPCDRQLHFPQVSLPDNPKVPSYGKQGNSLPPERSAGELGEARSAGGPLDGSAMPRAQMIPQVQALMNAARAMKPGEREKTVLARERTHESSSTDHDTEQVAHSGSQCEYPQTGRCAFKDTTAQARGMSGQQGPTSCTQQSPDVSETEAKTLTVQNQCVDGSRVVPWPTLDSPPFPLLSENNRNEQIKQKALGGHADDRAFSCGIATDRQLPPEQRQRATQLVEHGTPQIHGSGTSTGGNTLWSPGSRDTGSAQALPEDRLCLCLTTQNDGTNAERREEHRPKSHEESPGLEKTCPTGPAEAQTVKPTKNISNVSGDTDSAGQSPHPCPEVAIAESAVPSISSNAGNTTVSAGDPVDHDVRSELGKLTDTR